MRTRALSRDEFLATFIGKMERLAGDAEPRFDFWPYIDGIPEDAYQGFDCSAGTVEYVYRNEDRTFEHVLLDSNDRNVFMVVVLDLVENTVLGHHLLDLNVEYGLHLGPAEESDGSE